MNENQPLVCDLTAIPADVRAQHLAAIPGIFEAAERIQELPDGFAFRFQNEPCRFKLLANFVEYEQLCCPFEGFALEIEPYSGPIWLKLTGGEGYKEALAAGFRDMHEAGRNIITGPDDDFDEIIEQIAPILEGLLEKK
jgi:hypothetical protein